MRRLKAAVALAIAMPGWLGGCQEQKTVVVEQASTASVAAVPPPSHPPLPPLPRPRPRTPCDAPAGTGPFERPPRPISTKTIPLPPRVLAEHVSGCAGVRFRIGPDGVARDITVMADYPLGYGFGETARQAIAGSVWAPRDDLAWHYIVFHMNPPAPHRG
jgi:hypothetical protein